MRILLLTDIPPCENYTAGIIVNKWCDFLLEEKHEIVCALVKEPSLEFDIPLDKKEKITFLEIMKPREYWNTTKLGIFNAIYGFFRSLYMNNKIALKDLPKIADQIVNFAKDNKSELVFVLIQGQTLTRLVRIVSNLSGLKYVAQTWDPLEWWLKDYGFDKITSAINMREFSRVAKHAKCFASMSWAMSNMFETEYGAKCITNIPGLEVGKVKPSDISLKDKFVIAFAGQLYAIKELDILVKALEKMDWKHNGREIKLVLYGKKFDDKYNKYEGIKIKGYVPQGKLLSLLASADLLYCPYWFDKEFEKASRISFPSKLTSYLKSGVPVLVHAPSYASPRIFLEEYNAAYICGSMKEDDMVVKLKEIIEDSNRKTIANRGYDLFERYLTYKQMKKSLFASLGIIKRSEVMKFESVRKIYEN